MMGSRAFLAVGGQRSGGSWPLEINAFFRHNFVSFWPICMKFTPKWSEKYHACSWEQCVVAKVCALPSARSSLFIYLFICLWVCVSINSKSTEPTFMKFGGMIGHDLRTNRLDFGTDRVKGQGQGHEKVKNDFWPYLGQFWFDWHETRAKMCRIVCPIIWYVTLDDGVKSRSRGRGSKVRGVMTFGIKYVFPS